MPGENVFAAREVCRTALVVLGKCDSTHVHNFGLKKLGSVADGLLGFIDANAERTDVDGDPRLAVKLTGRVVAGRL